MSETNLTMDQFPLIAAGARNQARFEGALAAVINGVAEGAIRNVVLDDVKFVLSNAVNEGYKKHVKEPFFHGKGGQHAPGVEELNWSFNVYGLHDLIAASKKLAKTKVTGPEVDAMREFVNQSLPLALAVASLKSKVIKGRAPSTGPSKPENPNKDVKTCPCCFQQYAVAGGKAAGGEGRMVHHGYERPGDGYQTSSCPGIRFQSLDVSTDGLVWLIANARGRLQDLEASYAARDAMTQVVGRARDGKPAIIKLDDAGWARAFRAYVANLEMQINSLKQEIPFLEKKLATWKPGPQV